jgi:hypothetical protein
VGRQDLETLVELFKTNFFAIIKQAISQETIRKYWLTGVLPAFRDGISPLIGTRVISELAQYNGLCGLTGEEVETIASVYLRSTHSGDSLAEVLRQMKQWYNGHQFCPPRDYVPPATLYNPLQVFDHLRRLRAGERALPRDIDAIHCGSVLNSIPNDGAFSVRDLLPLLSGGVHSRIGSEFGARELQQVGRSESITWTLLYYYGVLTHGNTVYDLRIPNTAILHMVCIFRCYHPLLCCLT